MIEEQLTDEERQFLIALAWTAMPAAPSDPSDAQLLRLCVGVVSKLGGTDTVLVAQRAYPSLASRRSAARRDD